MVDLGAYVLLLVETKDKKIKLYGSPADKSNLEIGDEVLEINGKSLDNCTHDEAISYIHECIKSKTICLKVKRKSDSDEIDPLNDITDAYAIAVENRAKERLEKLAAKHNFHPLDMTQLVEPATPSAPAISGNVNGVPTSIETPIIDLSPPVYDTYYDTKGASPRRKSSSPSLLLARLRNRSSSIVASSNITTSSVDTVPTATSISTSRSNATNDMTEMRVQKYQNELSLREMEREAAQKERDFLRSSLRGSQRLQNLETPTSTSSVLGHANPAFSPSPPPTPKKRHQTHRDDHDSTSTSLDVDDILRKMDKLLTVPASSSPEMTAEDIANINVVRDFLRDPNLKDSLDIYATVNRCLKNGMLLAQPPLTTSSSITTSSSDQPSLLHLVTQVTQRLNASPGPSYALPTMPGLGPTTVYHFTESFQDPLIFNLILAYDEVSQLLAPNIGGHPVKGDKISNGELLSTPHPKNESEKGDTIAAEQTGAVPKAKYLDRTFQQYPENNIKIVKIEKGPDPLGATIRNEGDSVIVARIVKNGSAEKTGLLREGDEILEINGIEMRGKSVNEVCNVLSNLTGTLTFIIVPNRSIDVPTASGDHSQTHFQDDTPMSVRAYFSYDPEEDLYIPCRELGLSFQKGDILHVINQDDTNWWQAYREGEDVYGLAGLIPSKTFQIQRETLKMTLFAEAQNRHGKKRRKPGGAAASRKNAHTLSSVPGYSPYNASTFNNVNPHHNALNNNNEYNGGSHLNNATGTQPRDWGKALCGADSLARRLCVDSDCRGRHGKNSYLDDEYECDEILTYEEVELYYPRPDRKRPIVLIGPPDIGRHELRQKLMESFPDRFSAAVPHTSRAQKFGEIDGQDYHFLNRQAFESDIMAGKFVEHGEFEKNLYGTSLAAIKRVVDSEKSCILNLHPQSLKILYHSDLMPYVVFVAPPNIEKLKIIQEKRGVHKKDEELAEIIEKAREIEDNFGHYFDMIIINTDLNKTYNQLLEEINRIECEPQWVPKPWLHLYPPTPPDNDETFGNPNQYNPNLDSLYPNHRSLSGRHKFIP